MHVNNKSNLIAIFAIAALYAGTSAFAATETNPPPQKLTPQEKTVNKDFSKVSADGSGAFMDLTLTRLAVFDGRVDAAKKYIGAAEKALSRAKTDETRFLRDEARLNATKNTPMSNNGATPPTADQQSSSNNNQQNSANNQQNRLPKRRVAACRCVDHNRRGLHCKSRKESGGRRCGQEPR